MLLVMDVDSTLIQAEVIELIAAHAGTEAQVAEVTEAAMRGELDFAASLHARVSTLAGVPVSAFDDVREAVAYMPGARELVAAFRSRGWPVGLVSGGFEEVVRPLADELGIEHVRANRLQVDGGVLTGRVDGPVVDRAAKADFLRELAARYDIPMGRTVAVGDGANDIDMVTAAGTGVAFCARPALQAVADVVLDERRLDRLLPTLGLAQ